MIHIFNSCRNVSPNLKLFSRCPKSRQISLGKPNKCRNNDKKSVPEPLNPKNNEVDLNKSSNNERKELPEEPTTCCMSGCPNCVWLDYAEKLSEYYRDEGEQAVKEINEKVSDPNIKAFMLQELKMRYKK